MLQDLLKIVKNKEFRKSLGDLNAWKSLDIDYHPPRVLRLYRDLVYNGDNYRIYLHRILKTTKPCLFHKHRWPSAIYIIKGSYEMGLSYDTNPIPPLSTDLKSPIVSKLILPERSGYEMMDPHGIHYVKPITKESLSIMITGEPYSNVDTKESLNKKLKPLTRNQAESLLFDFSVYL